MKQKTIIFLFAIFACASLFAQDSDSTSTNKAKINVAADVMSRYVWRGLDYGASPSIQPTLSLVKGNFEIGYWGAMSILGTYSEADIYAKYTTNGISIIATDYFFPGDGIPSSSYTKYFNYDSKTTGHMVEAALQYKGGEKLPISLLAGTFIWGNDYDVNGDNRYSTYIEAGYTLNINDNNFDLFIGATTSEGAYGSEAGIVNAGITGYKTIKVTDNFELPVKASVVLNPQTENIHFVFGFTL
jgi:hypothetical protein